MKSISFQTPLPPALRTASPLAPEAAEGSESADLLSAAARPSPAQGCRELGEGAGGIRHAVRGGGRGWAGWWPGRGPSAGVAPLASHERGRFWRLLSPQQPRARGAPPPPPLRGHARPDPARHGGLGPAVTVGQSPPRGAGPGATKPRGVRRRWRGRYLPSAAAERDAGG